MSWAASTDALARDLARLLTHGGAVTAGGLGAALTARASVLELTTAVHTAAAGPPQAVGRPDRPGDLETDPVALLGRLLTRHPRLPTDPLLDTLASSSAPGRHGPDTWWRAVARHSAVAAHDWTAAEPATRPTGDAAWTAVGHAAALTQAVALLETDLAHAATAAGHRDVADVLTRAATSGLATAAGVVRDLAERGLLPDVPDPSPPASRAVLLVASPENLGPATQRLAHLITTAASLSPRDAQAVARAQAQVTARAARMLHQVLRHPAPVEQLALLAVLSDHAERLRAAGTRPGRTATLARSDPRPVLQAGEILRALAPGAPATTAPAAPGRQLAALVAYAHAAPAVTVALAGVAARELEAGRWLVPPGEDSPSHLTWVPVDPFSDPPLRRALAAAATHARALALAADRAAPEPPAQAAHLPGLDALADAITARQHAGVRPPSPAQPVAQRPAPLGLTRTSPQRGR